jgi:hypothetical protein
MDRQVEIMGPDHSALVALTKAVKMNQNTVLAKLSLAKSAIASAEVGDALSELLARNTTLVGEWAPSAAIDPSIQLLTAVWHFLHCACTGILT